MKLGNGTIMGNKKDRKTRLLFILFSFFTLSITSCGTNSNGINNTEQYGIFYDLEEAYTNGFLTSDNLENIAYYYFEETIAHDHSECDLFVPIPKTPAHLSNETETAIKKTYLNELQTRGENVTLYNIQINNYLGTYNDYIIVGVTDDYFSYDYVFEPERVIGGVWFRSYCSKFAQVWKLN